MSENQEIFHISMMRQLLIKISANYSRITKLPSFSSLTWE